VVLRILRLPLLSCAVVDHEAAIVALQPGLALQWLGEQAGEWSFTTPGLPSAQINHLFRRWSELPSLQLSHPALRKLGLCPLLRPLLDRRLLSVKQEMGQGRYENEPPDQVPDEHEGEQDAHIGLEFDR